MSFDRIRAAHNNPNKKEGMTAIIEIVNEKMTGGVFMIKRSHMATVDLFHCILNKEGKLTSSSRLMGGTEDVISTFLAGLYLGYELGVKDAG